MGAKETNRLDAIFSSWRFLDAKTAEFYQNIGDHFRAQGIETIGDLFHSYPLLSDEEKFVALRVFCMHPSHKMVPMLFKELYSPNAKISGAASLVIGAIGGDKIARRLMRLYDSTKDLKDRANVASALSHLRGINETAPLAAFFVRVMEDNEEPANLKAAFAEGSSLVFSQIDRRTSAYLQLVKVLMKLLDDSSNDVRSCAAYALGEFRERRP